MGLITDPRVKVTGRGGWVKKKGSGFSNQSTSTLEDTDDGSTEKMNWSAQTLSALTQRLHSFLKPDRSDPCFLSIFYVICLSRYAVRCSDDAWFISLRETFHSASVPPPILHLRRVVRFYQSRGVPFSVRSFSTTLFFVIIQANELLTDE